MYIKRPVNHLAEHNKIYRECRELQLEAFEPRQLVFINQRLCVLVLQIFRVIHSEMEMIVFVVF